MIDKPEMFHHFTETGWTAIGAMVTAGSIAILSGFNLYQGVLAHRSLVLLEKQLILSERPFVTIHSVYDDDLGARLVYARSQGNGPALDVEARLFYQGIEGTPNTYGIGCMTKEQDFQFLIGDKSKHLVSALITYRSISGHRWTTSVTSPGGMVLQTLVFEGHLKTVLNID